MYFYFLHLFKIMYYEKILNHMKDIIGGTAFTDIQKIMNTNNIFKLFK